jgi:predicted transcriptional regulator
MGSVTKIDEEEAQAQVEIWKYIFGFTNMAVVKCAIELGIADAIENNEGPMTLSELSSSLGCAPSSLYRIMRFLVHHNIFIEKPSSQGTTVYVQTALSRRLLKKGEKSMVDLLLLESSHVMMAPWHNLSSRVLNDNNSPFEGAHGDDIWKYALANPVHSKLIDDAMACDAKLVVPEIVEGFPEVFDGVKTLVDVGGGNGTTLQMLVKAFPWIQGINFDLPHVVSVASESEGVKHVGGDFFESVPKADAAFLMVSNKCMFFFSLQNWFTITFLQS